MVQLKLSGRWSLVIFKHSETGCITHLTTSFQTLKITSDHKISTLMFHSWYEVAPLKSCLNYFVPNMSVLPEHLSLLQMLWCFSVSLKNCNINGMYSLQLLSLCLKSRRGWVHSRIDSIDINVGIDIGSILVWQDRYFVSTLSVQYTSNWIVLNIFFLWKWKNEPKTTVD